LTSKERYVQPPDLAFSQQRLSALDLYNILDTPAEPGFDDVVLLATQICATPVALVSLVANGRQWFKAKIGFEPCETDLDRSVCAHALVAPDLLVITDLTKDDRTRENPLVTGEPHIRFYAGAPLRTPDGAVIGSLCVIDSVPRPEGLTEVQASGLRNLSRQVMSQLELRRALADRDAALASQRAYQLRRDQSEQQYRVLFEAIEDGFCIVEMKFEGDRAVDYRFAEINPAFASQTGLVDAHGKWMRELAPDHEDHWFSIYGNVARTGEPIRFEHYANELGERWFDVHAFRVGDPLANRVAILFNDKTDRKATEAMQKRAEDAQEVLNQELSHRMKNTFAMVQAIATQTLRSVEDRGPVEAFTQRLHALSAAHDVLLRGSWTAADFDDVVETVLSAVSDPERFEVSGPAIQLGARAALSVSLLLHELATNALKYGALSVETGRITVTWDIAGHGEEAELIMYWRERGGPPAREPESKGFGSKLINMGLVGTGGVALRYLPSGFEGQFNAPLAQVQHS
jgi:two-component sensor histidine kinase/PAS domain-containing protein